MNVLLLGNTGQLGAELARILPSLGNLVALDYPEIDMADADAIRAVLQKHSPDIILNATAYTAVDQAEREPELAESINLAGPALLAEEARKRSALLVHYSTDYVFDGKKGAPYLETDQPKPLNVYGLSKLHGEEAIRQADGNYLIFRTSWVYSLGNKSGFVQKALAWSRQHEIMRVVDDQISNPTWARMLAERTVRVLEKGVDEIKDKRGLYHLAGSGFISRFDWTRQILELDPNKEAQIVREILPAKNADFPTPAQRPTFSSLNCDLFQKTFGLEIPHWKESLRLAMEDAR